MHPAPAPKPAIRDDIFVSVCCADVTDMAVAGAALGALAGKLAAVFRYWELLLIISDILPEADEAALARLPNVRLLKIRHGTPFYRRRVAVASEAIGDIVVLAAIEELPVLDIVAMIDRAAQAGSIVAGKRANTTMFAPILRALGRGAGFRVNTDDMLTQAYPRTVLNRLLAHPDRQLALRFAPADRGIAVIAQPSDGDIATRSLRELGRRLSLIQRLLISAAPAVLTAVSLLSLLVAVVAVVFAIYAVIVWATLAGVQPGWFTTSLAISLTAAFLGVAIFGLSIGLQKLIEVLQSGPVDDIIGEASAVDLYGQVMHELNVEVAGAVTSRQGPGQAPAQNPQSPA